MFAVFGPWQTIWTWHRRIAGDGTWDTALQRLLASADAAGEVDWSVSVDSTFTSSASRRRPAKTFVANRCSSEAADTRKPGWSKTCRQRCRHPELSARSATAQAGRVPSPRRAPERSEQASSTAGWQQEREPKSSGQRGAARRSYPG